MPFKVLTVIAVDLHFVDCLCFQHRGMEYFTTAVAQQLYTSELKVNCNMHTLLFVSISEAAGMHMLQCSCELAESVFLQVHCLMSL